MYHLELFLYSKNVIKHIKCLLSKSELKNFLNIKRQATFFERKLHASVIT